MQSLFSVPISITSKPQALATVSQWLTERKKAEGKRQKDRHLRIITTPNPEMIVAAQSDPEFMKALQSADLAIPDGIGIIWGLKLLKLQMTNDKSSQMINKSDINHLSLVHICHSSLHRVSGLNFMESLIGESAKNGWKVMLLGGKPGVGEKAAAALRRNFKFQISNFKLSTFSGPQDISNISKSENDLLISGINSYSPDLLFVAFGHGKQEKWLSVNRERLNVGVAMGVGGAFDQIADPSLRPPVIINSIGLGWLYRLFREPWRWRRQLSLVKFIFMVINHKRINA